MGLAVTQRGNAVYRSRAEKGKIARRKAKEVGLDRVARISEAA